VALAATAAGIGALVASLAKKLQEAMASKEEMTSAFDDAASEVASTVDMVDPEEEKRHAEEMLKMAKMVSIMQSADVQEEPVSDDMYMARRRALIAIVSLSRTMTEWDGRMRCFQALVRLTKSGGGRPYLVVECEGLAACAEALMSWQLNPRLSGPDAALTLLNLLLHNQLTIRLIKTIPDVKSGVYSQALFAVLVKTPGVAQVQRLGLKSLWALVRHAGPESGVQEKLLEAGLFMHLEAVHQRLHANESVMHVAGGCLMQLAMGNPHVQAKLTEMDAQAYVGKIFAEHSNIGYQGAFAQLRPWLRTGQSRAQLVSTDATDTQGETSQSESEAGRKSGGSSLFRGVRKSMSKVTGMKGALSGKGKPDKSPAGSSSGGKKKGSKSGSSRGGNSSQSD